MPSFAGRRGFARAGDARSGSARCVARPALTSALPFVFAAVLLLAALVVVACWLGMRARAAFCDPSPTGQSEFLSVGSFWGDMLDGALGGMGENARGGNGEDDFPCVDWDYWREVNPNVVGWITVPGTVVDGPIVLASFDDPDYYLSHDVYGEYSWYGCFYLDASCAEGGLMGSRNAVVFGHNMSQVDGSMFTVFSEYVDLGFAMEHAEILLQTPEAKEKLAVVGARVVPGDTADKRTSFAGDEDFEAYRNECFSSCEVVLSAVDGMGAVEDPQGMERMEASSEAGEVSGFFTFVTCSYARYQNERTLVYAVLQE